MSPRKGAEAAEVYAMLERMPYGVIVHHERGNVMFANPQAAQLVGVATSDELIGRQISELFEPPYLKGLRNGLMAGTNGPSGIRSHVRERLLRVDGRVVDVELAAVPFLLAGEGQVQLMFHEVVDPLRPTAEVRQLGPVMVVDDEHLVRRAARRVLIHAGYEVIEAKDGQVALQHFLAAPGAFACVLLDMRVASGEELLLQMLASRVDLPVVLFSAHPQDARTLELMALGRIGVLRKPFGIDELREEIERVCRL